eukprot:3926787-Pleurochrysis_carterae.AAC.1
MDAHEAQAIKYHWVSAGAADKARLQRRKMRGRKTSTSVRIVAYRRGAKGSARMHERQPMLPCAQACKLLLQLALPCSIPCWRSAPVCEARLVPV